MNKIILIALSILCTASGLHAQMTEEIIIGRIERFTSSILSKELILSVHLPDDYNETSDRYPVLFTFQTHFEGVSGAVKNLYDYRLIPKIIVVRIDNYEFGYLTPTKIERDPDSGKADLFLEFFEQELFPHIDSNYRTQPYRMVFSNSWGAMFAVYAILAKPDVFNAAIASIPWVMYDGESKYMIKNTEKLLNSGTYNHILYMTMDDETELLSDLENFVDILRNNPKTGLDWEYHHWPEEDHTSCPYKSVYAGLRRLFKGWNRIPDDVANGGVQGVMHYENGMNHRFSFDIGVSPIALRIAAQQLERQEKTDLALSIYLYAAQKTPEDAFAYINLGRAYERADMLTEAREVFSKAYELAVSQNHAQVRWIKNFIDRIEEKIHNE